MANSYSESEIKDILSFIRLSELSENPIEGNFDITHLKEINSYIFQDSPSVAGIFRPEVKIETNKLWQKVREYKGFGEISVCYSNMSSKDIENLSHYLNQVKLADFKQCSKKQLAEKLAILYAQIDYTHPFPDGNSRTLREFFRLFCLKLGYKLNWHIHSQDEIYLARDYEVNNIMQIKLSNVEHI